MKQLRTSLRIFLHHQKISRQVRQQHSGIKVLLGPRIPIPQDGSAQTTPPADITRRDSMFRHFKAGVVSAFLAEHVWKHLTPVQADAACRNCYEALAPGGYLRMAVSYGLHPDPAYIEWVKSGGSGPGSDDLKFYITTAHFRPCLKMQDTKSNCWNDSTSRANSTMRIGMLRRFIMRSMRFVPRKSTNPKAYTSLIIDASKP